MPTVEPSYYTYFPALVLPADRPLEARKWIRVLHPMTDPALSKCIPNQPARGLAFEFFKRRQGNQTINEPRFLARVHSLVEESFDTVPILSNLWYSSQETRANVVSLLRSLPPEVTPPVIDAPRVYVPEPEEKPLTAAELKSLLNQGWFKKEPEPTPPPAAPPVPAEVLAELEQLRRRDAERELEIERLRKENLQAKRATDAAVRIGQELADASRLPASTLPDGMSQEEYDLLATKGAGTIVSQELKASLPATHPIHQPKAPKQERGAA